MARWVLDLTLHGYLTRYGYVFYSDVVDVGVERERERRRAKAGYAAVSRAPVRAEPVIEGSTQALMQAS